MLPIFSLVVMAYVLGSIPFGFLIGKLNGIDIRTVGSCNIGATNVTRTLGKKWGWPCFLLDASKGFLPAFITQCLSLDYPEIPQYLPAVVALVTVLGHIFPIWLKFKGGKGVATIIGALCALSWFAVSVGVGIWLVSFFIWRYVSLASILMMIALPLALIAEQMMWGKEFTEGFYAELVLFLALGVLSIVKHRSNIIRIWNGTEHKFISKKEVS